MADEERYSEKDAKTRFEKALRGAVSTPPKPLKTKAVPKKPRLDKKPVRR
jgi:hypothetical protein